MSQQQPTPNHQSNVVLVQKHVRGMLGRSQIKLMLKRLTKRKYVLEELISSEEGYIRDLGLIVSDFKMALISRQLLDPIDIQVVFSNIDEIRRLHEDFFTTLHNAYYPEHPYNIIFAPILKNILFFRIYIEYLNNFPSAYQHVLQLSKQKPDFAEFVDSISKKGKYKFLHLEDYLIKPVQRLPKYVLLLKQIEKNTSSDHPDYGNIVKALEKFQQVNNNNNDKLAKLRESYKLAEIENSLCLPEGTIGAGVEFVMEDTVQLLTPLSKIITCHLYVLNTCVIMSRRIKQAEKLEAIIAIKHGTSLIYNQDQSCYKFTITLQSLDGESSTFLCSSQEELEKLSHVLKAQIVQSQLQSYSRVELLYRNNSTTDSFLKRMNVLQLMPEVSILGTTERNDKFLKYTIYIAEVKIKSVRQKIFLRFSEVLEIQDMMKREFPELQIKQGMVEKGWLKNHVQKTIESRKMNIQRFLKEILCKQEIMERGQYILMKLGLPLDFYQLPKKFQSTDESFKRSGINRHKSSIKQQKQQKRRVSYRLSLFQQQPSSSDEQQVDATALNIQQILKANEMDLGHFTRLSELILQSDESQQELTILIPCINSDRCYRKQKIKCNRFQRIQCLMPLIAKSIHLKYWKDFRVFMEKDYFQRVVDDDEIIIKVMNEVDVGGYQLCFRKMIFIDADIQAKELQVDHVRLRIVASQAILEVKKGKYKLSYDRYMMFAVLCGMVLPHSRKQLAKITKSIVLPKYTTLQHSQHVWQEDYTKLYRIIESKLSQIEQRRQQESDGWMEMGRKQLAYLSIIKQIEKEYLYGSFCFTVQISQQLQDYIDKHLLNEDEEERETHNCWLAVNSTCINLVSISVKIKIMQILYENIVKIQPFSNYLMLTIKHDDMLALKLKTVESYYIRELLLYYTNYHKVFKKTFYDPFHFDEHSDQYEYSYLK